MSTIVGWQYKMDLTRRSVSGIEIGMLHAHDAALGGKIAWTAGRRRDSLSSVGSSGVKAIDYRRRRYRAQDAARLSQLCTYTTKPKEVHTQHSKPGRITFTRPESATVIGTSEPGSNDGWESHGFPQTWRVERVEVVPEGEKRMRA